MKVQILLSRLKGLARQNLSLRIRSLRRSWDICCLNLFLLIGQLPANMLVSGQLSLYGRLLCFKTQNTGGSKSHDSSNSVKVSNRKTAVAYPSAIAVPSASGADVAIEVCLGGPLYYAFRAIYWVPMYF